MHGLLMSLRRVGLWLRRGEKKKSHTVSPWSFLGVQQAEQKQCSCSKCKLLGQRSLGSPLQPCPPFYSAKYRGSVKSILGGAIVFQEGTVKLEWWRPGLGQGTSSKSKRSGAVFLKNSWLEVRGVSWAAHRSAILLWIFPRNCCYSNKASCSVASHSQV